MAQAAAVAGDVHVTGRRVIAVIVDGVILAVVNTVIMFVFDAVAGTEAPGLSLQGLPAFVFFLVSALVSFGYFAYLEGTRGQTPGKMLAGIKVVLEGTDAAPGFGPAAIRTVMRLIDGLFLYLVGFIAVMVSAKNQRLGDMVANTLVVRK